MSQRSRGRRRGYVFSLRLTDDERCALEALQREHGGPSALGPWLVWRALAGITPPDRSPVVPRQVELDRSSCIILDLCAGSGAWSEPYWAAGYDVRRVTLPDDVRTFVPPANVHGILAAPPCTEFSLAKNGQPRDLPSALEVVAACMRVILTAAPSWWALENPVGLLGHYLGRPRDVFQPHDFGDPWTKRTSLWGSFALPRRGPFVEPNGSAMDRATAPERAITSSGFAAAFFEANP